MLLSTEKENQIQYTDSLKGNSQSICCANFILNQFIRKQFNILISGCLSLKLQTFLNKSWDKEMMIVLVSCAMHLLSYKNSPTFCTNSVHDHIRCWILLQSYLMVLISKSKILTNVRICSMANSRNYSIYERFMHELNIVFVHTADRLYSYRTKKLL